MSPEAQRIMDMTPEQRKQYDHDTGATAGWIKFNAYFWGAIFGFWAVCVISNMVH